MKFNVCHPIVNIHLVIDVQIFPLFLLLMHHLVPLILIINLHSLVQLSIDTFFLFRRYTELLLTPFHYHYRNLKIKPKVKVYTCYICSGFLFCMIDNNLPCILLSMNHILTSNCILVGERR